ncbi:MAG: FAD-binding oxidoreductase [Alphaproteobacteria bacterium]|nr:FAD-binding oxidoreductase [Alphaproteobacteria bacterium]
MTAPVPETVWRRLEAALGPKGFSRDPDRIAPKLVEWRDRWRGSTPFLALPATTDEVAAVVRICGEAGLPMTPQGGNTGLVGGQIPQGEVLISTERLGVIRALDLADDVLVAEAGVTLAAVHAAAEKAGRRFPLDLASAGSATIGGLVSTNAGGTAVLRHGTMRHLVLGLEAVLPDGEIWRGLRRLRKDNTGYDLKQLLIGAEGTLGIVTAAALKLAPPRLSRAVAMAGVASPEAAVALLTLARETVGDTLEAFELIARLGIELAVGKRAGAREPLEGRPPWYVLIEVASVRPDAAPPALEALLTRGLEDGLILDAAVAASETQANAFWALREAQSEAQKGEGPVWKHDVATPVSRIAAFIARASELLRARYPGVRIDAFGHVGDGNIHFDVLPPPGGDFDAHAAAREEAARLVHDLVTEMEGTISAEHGLGVLKTKAALAYKSAAETAAQRAVRQALDPRRLMNPRVLF